MLLDGEILLIYTRNGRKFRSNKTASMKAMSKAWVADKIGIIINSLSGFAPLKIATQDAKCSQMEQMKNKNTTKVFSLHASSEAPDL